MKPELHILLKCQVGNPGITDPPVMSGAEVQQPGLTPEVPEPSMDAQEIPLQSPRDRKDWAAQVTLVCGVGEKGGLSVGGRGPEAPEPNVDAQEIPLQSPCDRLLR